MTLTSTAWKPWTVERHDQEDGSISYEVWDTNPDSYRRVCSLNDGDNEEGRNAKRDAYAIAAASAYPRPAAAEAGVREALEKLVRLTKFELGRNASREPWRSALVHADAALSSIIPATKGGVEAKP